MNRNSVRTKVRVAACCLAGAVVITGSSFVSEASVTAGAGNLANLVAQTKVQDAGTDASLTAGVTRNIAQYLADNNTNQEAADNEAAGGEAAADQTADSEAAETQVAENDAPVVKSEFADIGVSNVDEDSYINIRQQPTTDSEIVGKLYAKSAVTVLGMEGEWYQIHSGNCEGYIKQDYIIAGDEELAKSISTRVAIVDVDHLNIRADQTTEGTILGQVDTGAVLLVVSEGEEWLQVSTDEGEGYISAEYAHCTNFYKVAESREEEEARLKREEEARREREAASRRSSSGSSSRSSQGSSNSNSDTGSARTYNPPSGGSGSAVANYACQFVGNPYVYGGSSLTNGADCSGFVMAVYGDFGIGLPHSSSALRSVGYGVSASEMQPGDIVCYSGHVGIYVGDGTIVHASTPSTGIKYGNAYYKDILAVRRIY